MGNMCEGPSREGIGIDRSAKFTSATQKDLLKTYEFDPRVIGEGQFGKVFAATNKEDISIKVAIKEINI